MKESHGGVVVVLLPGPCMQIWNRNIRGVLV